MKTSSFSFFFLLLLLFPLLSRSKPERLFPYLYKKEPLLEGLFVQKEEKPFSENDFDRALFQLFSLEELAPREQREVRKSGDWLYEGPSIEIKREQRELREPAQEACPIFFWDSRDWQI